MNSRQFVYLGVILMVLIKCSSEDCQIVQRYGFRCDQRNSDKTCQYFRHMRCYIFECYYLHNLNIDNLGYRRDMIEIFNSHFEEMTAGLFRGFDSFQNLTIFDSNISNLKPGVFHSLHLFYLNLSHNSIQSIPNGVFNDMYTLISLDLSKNTIESIDNESFIGMENLEEFYLNDNKISNMPPLTGCAKLTTLDMSNNEISNLDFLHNCSQIRVLNIAGNDMEYLDNKVLDTLQKLVSLDLSRNTITFISNDTIAGMESLEKLYLNGNRLSHMPSLDNAKLMILDVSSNKINNLDTFQHLTNLKKLNISQNPFFRETDMPVDLFRNTPSLEVLNMSRTSIKKLKVGSFSRLKRLDILDLSLNNLAYLPKGIFHDLTSLDSLYINDNQLSRFEYDGFSNLRKINLNGNNWDCHTLSGLITSFEYRIIRGAAYNTTNVYGIPCYEETRDFQTLPEHNSSNLNELDKEYLSYIAKSQNDISRALTGLGNFLNQTIPNQKDQTNSKLVETFENFKHFLNETNTYQKNYSENYWKSLETYQSSLTQSLMDIKNILLSFKTASQPLAGDVKFATNAEKLTVQEENFLGKSANVALYSMLVILCAIFILFVSKQFKKFRRSRSERIECNSLSALQV